MDEMDKQLLIHMEMNSRLSLKKLAQEINVKTSTLYHRLHKLSESKIIQQNSVIINPYSIGVETFYLILLNPVTTSNKKPDQLFWLSFSTFLTEQFKEIYFGAVGENFKLYLLVSFFSKAHHDKFFKTINENPYIGVIEKIQLDSISKGLRMFSFNDEALLEDLKSKYNHNINNKSRKSHKSLNYSPKKIRKDPKQDIKKKDEDFGDLIELD